MKIYLVIEVSHRVDGTSVVHCVAPGNQRSLKLRLTGGTHRPPIIAGTAYGFTWKYYLGRKQILTVLPVPIPEKFWTHLVLKNFYANDLQLPSKIRSTLLGINSEVSKKLLEDLSQQDFGLFEKYLPEPYISGLKFHCKRFANFQVAMASMMLAGITQQASEVIYNFYGDDYSEIIQSPARLMEFQVSTATAMSEEYRFLEWLDHKACCGSTIVDGSDIPAEFSNAIDWCKQNRLVIGGFEKLQITTHAIQQRLLRLEIQRVCSGFFPKYASSEIDYAYSRYSGLMGMLYEQSFLEAVSTAVNSRISYICSDSANTTDKYITEVSAILQLLGNRPPYLALRNLIGAQIYSSADADLISLKNFPEADSNYRTFIVPDLHHYTVGEYHQLFSKLTEKDRVIAISNLAIATEFHVSTQIAKQLAAYFPSADITSVNHVGISSNIQTSPLDISDIVAELNSAKMLVAVCDHPGVITTINNMLRKKSEEAVLISASSVFRRNDKVTIHPSNSQPEPAFFCRLLSTNDKGVYAEAPSGHIRISSFLIKNSCASPGFAMTPELACSIGILEAVLVCKDTNRDGLLNILFDHKITIKKCFTYQTNELPHKTLFSIQRITPSIE